MELMFGLFVAYLLFRFAYESGANDNGAKHGTRDIDKY